MAQTVGTHQFRKALNEAVADAPGGLGGNITRSKACASRGDDQIAIGGIAAQSRCDLVDLVRQRLGHSERNSSIIKQIGDGRAG